MIKKWILALCLLSLPWSLLRGQEATVSYNNGFEQVTGGAPDGWGSFGSDGYQLGVDSTEVHGGKYAAKISCPGGEPGFRAWSFTIPGSYEGKAITLSGWVRTEKVANGWAGLWMRIDPNVAFDNMSQRGITGTTGWQRVEITLDLNPRRTRQIVFGGLLAGTGQAWFDDLSVTVDGKDIAELHPIGPKEYPADSDREFDDGSRIGEIEPSSATVDHLYALGLAWGFLKYYHPAVAEGHYNWDYELFRLLPGILAAGNATDRDKVLAGWIDRLKGTAKNENSAAQTPPEPGATAGKPDDKVSRQESNEKASEKEAVNQAAKSGVAEPTNQTTGKGDTNSAPAGLKAKEQPAATGIQGANPDEPYPMMEPDLGWINDIGLSRDLCAKLNAARAVERNGDHYYIDLDPMVGNPVFLNERSYKSMTYPDEGFRLLSLYRYWNIIQYFFPYRNLLEQDWKATLKEFIPKFLEAKNELEYQLTVLELVGRIPDTHANLWGFNEQLNLWKGQRYAPVELGFVGDSAVVKGFYTDDAKQKTGLKPGDVICGINGKPVDEIIAGRLRYYPASNRVTQLRDLAGDLLRSNDTVIRIEVIRGRVKETRTLRTLAASRLNIRAKYDRIDTCFRIPEPGIAWLYPGKLRAAYIPQIMEEVKNTRGLIIDLRCYPREFIVFTLGAHLVSQPAPFARFSHGSLEQPGLFTVERAISVGSENKNYYKGKVVILVDGTTVSQAEYTAMALRVAPGAVVIGSTTAAADGNVSQFTLPGNLQTRISGIGVYYPDGRETQQVGIVPDIVVKPTIKGIREGRDEVLERAVEEVRR